MPWNSTPVGSTTAKAKRNARSLRAQLTEPERRLWWHLRHRLPIEGSHFRRQVPIGSYVADFCCLSRRLVIEVDGGGHGHDAQAAYDARRTVALEVQGFRVLRFTNMEVMQSINAVLDTIAAALSPPPCGEGSGVGVAPPASGRSDLDPPLSAAPLFKPETRSPGGTTPTPSPSPQGGGERAES